MKNYNLTEKGGDKNTRLEYFIEIDNGAQYVWLTRYLGVKIEKILLATEITENNRGWSFETCHLSDSFIKIYLTRGKFIKSFIKDDE